MKGVQSNLVGYFSRIIKTGKSFAREVAVRTFMPLHGYQARRQTAAKEFSVEEIIGGSQAGVCLRCSIVHICVLTLFFCIVRYNFTISWGLCQGARRKSGLT